MKINRIGLFLSVIILITASFFPAAYASGIPSEKPVPEEASSGTTPVFGVKGDADCDGKVTAADARIALRISVSLEKPAQEVIKQCDYDEDKKVTAADARCILRVSVGLDPFKTQAEIEREQREAEERQFREYINGTVKSVKAENVSATLTYLTKQTPDRGLYRSNNDKAEKYLVSRLKEMGYADNSISVHVSSWNGARCADVVARIPTSVQHPKIYLLSAHYDCCENVEGAVDNASGVAAVMEAARVFKAMNKDFGVELRFAFFDAEEKGYVGAYRYLSANTDDEEARHVFMLNVDMAGYSELQPQKYLVVSTEPVCEPWPWRQAHSNFTSDSVDTAKKHLGNIGEEKYYSPVAAGMHDIVPFRKNGMACATLSWRQYAPGSSHGSDHGLASPYTIHTSLDTLENLNVGSVTSTTKLIVCTVLYALSE